jgi:hypothetical protein
MMLIPAKPIPEVYMHASVRDQGAGGSIRKALWGWMAFTVGR